MRLDQSLVIRDLVVSRSQAIDLIKRGYVFVNEQKVTKPAFQTKEDDFIQIDKNHIYVSRGGDKLYPFITSLQLPIYDTIALDIGSSTGGFTEVLLSLGAKKVICVDVGKDQLAQHLLEDQRVIALEQTNILAIETPVHHLSVIDVSFTSVIPILKHIYQQAHHVIVLIKPQFEQQNQFKDVIKNDNQREKILHRVLDDIKNIGYHVHQIEASHVRGKKGNQEYFVYMTRNTYDQNVTR